MDQCQGLFRRTSVPNLCYYSVVEYGNRAVDCFNKLVLSNETTRLMPEASWTVWKHRLQTDTSYDDRRAVDNRNRIELYVLRMKICHLFHWLSLWESFAHDRFIESWWNEYYEGGQRVILFSHSWVAKTLGNDIYDHDAVLEDDDILGASDRKIV